MELKWLEDFLSFARTGSFSRSAVERHVTQPAFGRRIRALHRSNTSDNVGRWLTAAMATVVLATSLILTAWFAAGVVTSRWQWGPLMVQWLFPAALWLTAVYTAVVKFIGYLDLRIRREGWEVELKVRAAAQELLEKQRLQSHLV